MDERWVWRRDMNLDGAFTISDLWLWVQWVFFAPGDAIIWIVAENERLAVFFEMPLASYGTWSSGALSVVAWFIALIFAGMFTSG